MKYLLTLIILSLQLSLVSAQSYLANNAKSNVVWKGYGEIGGFTQTGTINLGSTDIIYDGSNLSGEIIVDMKTISHEDKQLEKHLKAKDFFNVKKHPESRFEIQKFDGKSVSGILTMNGYSNDLTFDVSIVQNESDLIVKGTAKIDRTKFDIKYNSSSFFQDLGNYAIKNEFDLEFDIVFEKK